MLIGGGDVYARGRIRDIAHPDGNVTGIVNLVESIEPKRGNLVQHCALVRNGVSQDHVKSRYAIRDDKEKRLAKVKDFAHLSAAQFFYPGQID